MDFKKSFACLVAIRTIATRNGWQELASITTSAINSLRKIENEDRNKSERKTNRSSKK